MAIVLNTLETSTKAPWRLRLAIAGGRLDNAGAQCWFDPNFRAALDPLIGKNERKSHLPGGRGTLPGADRR